MYAVQLPSKRQHLTPPATASTVTSDPVIHFLVFVPSASHKPLYIIDSQGKYPSLSLGVGWTLTVPVTRSTDCEQLFPHSSMGRRFDTQSFIFNT